MSNKQLGQNAGVPSAVEKSLSSSNLQAALQPRPQPSDTGSGNQTTPQTPRKEQLDRCRDGLLVKFSDSRSRGCNSHRDHSCGCRPFFSAFSIRSQAKSTDLNSLFQLAREIREAEERLFSAKNEEDKLKEINNYFNILEIFAASVNNDLFGKTTQKMAAERLVNDISILMAGEYTRQKIQDAVTSELTFQELSKFAGKYRDLIQARTKQKEALNASN